MFGMVQISGGKKSGDSICLLVKMRCIKITVKRCICLTNKELVFTEQVSPECGNLRCN